MSGMVFVDRDGVINDPVLDPHDGRPESPLRAADVRLVPGAVEGLHALIGAGVPLSVVSNQPAAAKGKATLSDLQEVHERVVALLNEHEIEIADWRYCHHHPDAVDPGLRAACDCRKPAPGMLRDAAAFHGAELDRSWIAGDSQIDIAAGVAAGAGTVLITHPCSAHRRGAEPTPDAVVADLREAAAFLLDGGRLRGR